MNRSEDIVKTDLLDLTSDEMKTFAAELGEKPFRGKQVFQWIGRGVSRFEEMTDLPKDLRRKLDETACIGRLTLQDVKTDTKDGTRKFLFGLEDDRGGAACAVESVFMKYSYGNTLCLSTQVGCRMGCAFCASARGGFIRNLTAGEMMAQIHHAEAHTGEKIGHIVLMGMGEPFDNYENVSRFLRILHDENGRNMSWRNMTVSTSGIIPVMERFGDDFPQVNLAVSLHRADQEGRSRIMPVSRRYPLDELLKAASEYTEKTGRRITFEYALIRGENDSGADILNLKKALSGMLCHVNLIPLNKVSETGFEGSSRKRAEIIAEELRRSGIPATVRRELGREIDGACGQLRLRHLRQESENGG